MNKYGIGPVQPGNPKKYMVYVLKTIILKVVSLTFLWQRLFSEEYSESPVEMDLGKQFFSCCIFISFYQNVKYKNTKKKENERKTKEERWRGKNVGLREKEKH